MTIHGQFKDLKDNTISVVIYKSGDSSDYPIDDYFYTDNHNPNAGHLCFNGNSPVKITRKCNDLFKPYISTSCKIKLLADIWCGDILFSEGIGDIIVKVTRTQNTQGAQEEILFVGYAQPLSFSQNINKRTNIIDIKCTDILGFLKDKKLSTGSTYENLLLNAHYRTFSDLFKAMNIYNNTAPVFTFPGSSYNTNLYVDTAQKDKLALQISDNLWLSDSADNEMDLQAILVEMLKYMNSRIVSTNGLDYYIIDNSNDSTINSLWYVNIDDSADLPSLSDTTPPQEDIANEQVTIDECYNRISVKCELETVDDVITSPLEEEDLYSNYNNRQKFMTEMAAPSKEHLSHMISNRGIESSLINVVIPGVDREDEIEMAKKCWTRDYYVRVMKSKSWDFKNNFEDPDFPIDGWTQTVYYPVKDTNGNWINQNKSVYDLGQLRVGYAFSENNRMGSYILKYAKSEQTKITDNTINSKADDTTCLVIPVNGRWYDGRTTGTPTEEQRANAEDDAMQHWETYLKRYADNDDPMCKYSSTTTVNFTPADANTINYIVISGKLTCTPLFNASPHYNTVNGDVISLSSPKPPGQYNPITDVNNLIECNARVDDDAKYYYRYLWDETYVNTTYTPTSEPVAARTWAPFIECEKLKDFKYDITNIGSQADSHQVVDEIKKVPILSCQLKIGDKYVNEILSSDGKSSTYEWSTDPTSMFTIGINPAVEDFIIGKSWDIMNDITTDMNINASGIAIPIKYTDNIKGNIEFKILGPYNLMWDITTYENHCRWRHFWGGYPRNQWTHTNYSLLNHIQSIIIDKFEMKAYSDNAKNATLNSGDLLYYSEDNLKYNNPKDNIEFKITTALTSEQAAEMDIANGVSFNNPTDDNNDLYTTADTDEARPERKYIKTMYDLYSTPKKIVEYQTNIDDLSIDALYRTVYSNNLMSHLNVSNFNSIVTGDEMDLKNNRIKITTREI